MTGARLIIGCLAALILASTSPAWGEAADSEGEDVPTKAVHPHRRGGYGIPGLKRWRPEPVPLCADDARDQEVEETIREAPPLPPLRPNYRGPQEAMKAARYIRKTVPTFINFRSTILRATWRSTPAHEWRVRSRQECLAGLRAQGIRVKVWRPASEETTAEGDEDALERVPAPVYVRAPIKGVLFRSGYGGRLLLSCEMVSRLQVIADIVSRHGVDQVVVVSAWRPRPRTSFHTMGLGMDIMRFHLVEPQPGPRGEMSDWLNVFNDFLATPDLDTCDPAIFEEDSPLGDNERGRRLSRIACELHASGVFGSVLTPNYNPGHRDHFHIDIRPDDPRIFLR